MDDPMFAHTNGVKIVDLDATADPERYLRVGTMALRIDGIKSINRDGAGRLVVDVGDVRPIEVPRDSEAEVERWLASPEGRFARPAS